MSSSSFFVGQSSRRPSTDAISHGLPGFRTLVNQINRAEKQQLGHGDWKYRNRGQTTISTGVIEDKSRLLGFSM